MRNKAILLDGNVGWVISKMTIFMTVGMLGMILFSLVDTFFISRLGERQLAAISYIFPVIYIFNSIAIGIGNGASVLISKAIGAKDNNLVKDLTTNAIVLAVLLVLIFVLIGWFSIRPVFSMLGASGETLEYIVEYMQIWYAGMLFVVVPMVGNGAIRATGDVKTPTLIMLTAVIINVIMDWLLIFGHGPFPRMEMQGAALATVIARSITFTFALLILYFREKMLSASVLTLKRMWASWKKILYIGLPGAGSHLIMPIGVAILTRIIAEYGDPAVAGYGVATRVQAVVLSILIALSSVIGPFIGQNLGANRFDRIRQGISFSYKFSFVWGLVALGILLLFAESIATIFSDNAMTNEVTKLCLYILPIGFAFQGIMMIAFSTMTVINKPIQAALVNVIYMFGLYIPLALVLSMLFELRGVFASGPISLFIVAVFIYLWLKKLIDAQEKSLKIRVNC